MSDANHILFDILGASYLTKTFGLHFRKFPMANGKPFCGIPGKNLARYIPKLLAIPYREFQLQLTDGSFFRK